MSAADGLLLVMLASVALTAMWVVPLVACAKRRDSRPAGWGLLTAAGVCGVYAGTGIILVPLLDLVIKRTLAPNAAVSLTLLVGAIASVPLGAVGSSLFAYLALLRAWRACEDRPAPPGLRRSDTPGTDGRAV